MSRNWAAHTKKIVDEIEGRFDLPVPCTTYKGHGVVPSGRDGEPFGVDVWVAPYGKRANQTQEALGDAIQKWLEANWDRLGIHYVIWWGWMTYRPGQWFVYDPGTYKNPLASPAPETVYHRDHVHIQVTEADRYTPPKDESPGVDSPLWGVDLSSHQGNISHAQIRREGYSYAICKATEGTYYTDTYYAKNVRDAQAAGLIPGAYHFLTNENVWQQIDRFLATVGSVEGKLIALDVEDPNWPAQYGNGSPSKTDVWNAVHYLHEKTNGHPILIYSGYWYWGDRLGNPDIGSLVKDKNCRLWVSRYVSGQGYGSSLYQSVPAAWWEGRDRGGFGNHKPTILQFTESALVASQYIDANAFRGTVAELKKLTTSSSPIASGYQVRIGTKDKPLAKPLAESIANNQRKVGRAANVVELKETSVGAWEPAGGSKLSTGTINRRNTGVSHPLNTESHGPSNGDTALRPTRKVSAATVAVLLTTIIAYVLNQFYGIELPPEVSAAITGLLGILAAYFVPEGE